MDSQKFAKEWIKSWNSHNLDDILSHYSDDIEITSPKIKSTLGIDIGSLKGKELIEDYWSKALQKSPDLHFELIEVAAGVSSVALYYKSVMKKMGVEVMFFNEQRKVNRMFAHYT
ncbi:MAG TPA: nuclear transport factor 2 family protein [Chitinophagaceae bacterium]|nr:nuclear transport factor 2 family protein [Chitinophagaceae bacterium]